jgi:quercetin dioxygenase-like cupin family protein
MEGTMKKLLGALVLVGGLALVAHAEAPKAMSTTAADMKFVPIPNTTAQVATLWGDFTKTAHGVMVKFVPGEEHPLHTHSANIKVVVISGTFYTAAKGEKPKMYGPGSFVMVPAGTEHVSGCDKSGPCLTFQEGDGAFDMKPVATAAKTPAKK